MNYHRNHLTARQLSDRLLLAHYDTGNPARAWLIAILEALIAKEDHTNDE